MYPMKRECVLFVKLSDTILHWNWVTESRDTEALGEKRFQKHDYTKIEKEVETMKRSPSDHCCMRLNTMMASHSKGEN